MSGDLIIEEASVDAIEEFLRIAGSSLDTFRYFEKRPLKIIKNHLKTLLVYQQNTPVGYGHLDLENDVVWLGICVASKFKGLGIGKLIMNELIHEGRKLDISEIKLSVDAANTKAEQLYQKFGFEEDQLLGNTRFMKLVL